MANENDILASVVAVLASINFGKLASGVVGSLVSMNFVAGSRAKKLSMAIGGSALSYYASTPAAMFIETPTAEGLVGFLLGLFGMAIMAKVYEVIQMIDAKQVAADAWTWFTRKWKA